jgi:ribosomal protein S18 acetylase RimI-like enzyme
MQFTFQHRHYSTHFPQATFMVLERRGQLMGKLYLGFTDGEIRIIDIALASAYCNRNIGKAVLQNLQQQAAACGSAVSLNVNPVNPARRFYERLGFHVVRQDETCVLMRWTAE